MEMKKTFASICLCLLLSSHAFAASSRDDLQARVDAAKVVLDQILNAQDRSIPLNILHQATCVAVVPGMLKGAFVGGQSTDLVLVAVNDRGFQDLLKNKFKIGGDASAAAGPVGRSGQASTDWKMNAELLSYSRTKGLFAGIDLDGTSVSQNKEDTDVYFGAPHDFDAVLKGDVPVPEGAVPFVRTVAHAFVSAHHQ